MMKSIKSLSYNTKTPVRPVPKSRKTSLQRRVIREWRFAACAVLAFNQALSALWFEDVLSYHNGGVELDELCLLVEDIENAAAILEAVGYRRLAPTEAPTNRTRSFSKNGALLSYAGAKAHYVLLLSAKDWHYDLRLDELHDHKCPWLPRFLDSLMSFWLSVPPEDYGHRRDIMDYVADVVARCYSLDDFGQKVAKNKYAYFLDLDHYELHFDIVARCKNIIRQDFEHQERHAHHVARCLLIREGKFQPRPYRRGRFYPQLPMLPE